ncbi:MAG: 16S rRNA (adenine(1518)-N(6)/adenine(1519)-N(6))-dimethyltransferase RsmA [Pseudomonadota bacterium]
MHDDADGLPPLREVIKELQLSARKSLGQNFILDLNLTRRIARSAPKIKESCIVEIGPGPGGLTRALLSEGAKKVIAIEKDKRCLPALEEIAQSYPDQLDVYNDDALELDITQYIQGPAQIVANLPYSVGTALLINWLQTEPWPPWFSCLTLMFQREVAERLVAKPNTKSYGRLSVLTHFRTTPRILFHLPARAFTPPPKVDSTLVQLIPHNKMNTHCSVAHLEQVTSAAFGQRRKMLRQSLRTISSNPLCLLEAANIDPSLRAENIDIEGYNRLALALSKQ